MQGQFALMLNQNFGWVPHELFAGLLHLSGEGGSEHHNLFVMRSLLEDLLHVASHVHVVKDLVALVEDKHLEFVQVEGLVPDEGKSSSWSSHNDVRSTWAFEDLLLG